MLWPAMADTRVRSSLSSQAQVQAPFSADTTALTLLETQDSNHPLLIWPLCKGHNF